MRATDQAEAAVTLAHITKSFAGLKVVKDVSFDVRPGEVHALLGENGAGKSTLIKIMAGLYQPDEGEIAVNGTPTKFAMPRDAHAAGIATVHQELLLFPELTVAENIFLGQTPKTKLGMLDWPAMRSRARALSQDARVVIMDEPTAALADADVARLMDIVRRLKSRGVAIVYVSHRMPEIFALADRVTVLRDGARVGTKDIGEVDEGVLVNMMVGRAIDRLYPKKLGESGASILELREISHRSAVRDISFELRAGEILGIAGLVGSGRTELALTIFGITPATSGTILLGGKPVRIGSPEAARDLGIAYIPEDRGTQGLIRTQTIAENVALANLKKLTRGLFIDAAKLLRSARQAIEKFGIKARGPQQMVRELSGGNQQKVVLGKWLSTDPRILIMDEPTRGIDVGAKAEIHQLMRKLAAEGMAILMISSELPEVLGMSDRVLVMNGGRIVAGLGEGDATPEAVGAAMSHAGTRKESA